MPAGKKTLFLLKKTQDARARLAKKGEKSFFVNARS
jgi:hypothetical protein